MSPVVEEEEKKEEEEEATWTRRQHLLFFLLLLLMLRVVVVVVVKVSCSLLLRPSLHLALLLLHHHLHHPWFAAGCVTRDGRADGMSGLGVCLGSITKWEGWGREMNKRCDALSVNKKDGNESIPAALSTHSHGGNKIVRACVCAYV